MAMAYTVKGPCTIVWGAVTRLTFTSTLEGVILRPTEQWNPVSSDKYGQMIAALIHSGKMCDVEFTCMDPEGVFDLKANDDFIEGLLFSLKTGATLLASVGATVRTTYTDELTITDGDAQDWVAAVAFPLDPAQIIMSSVQEIRMPIVFRCLRDVNGDVFSSVPALYQA